MDSLLFKSFLPEIFLSISILLQIIFNTRFINDIKNNFPLIGNEVFYQTIFILFLYIILLNDLNIEGILGTNTLSNDFTIRLIKQIFCFFIILTLYFVNETKNLQKMNFVELYFIILLAILSLLLIISTTDLLMFYILMEMQALCFYILATYNRTSILSIEAGLKYFLSGAFISSFYLLGVSILYGTLGTINLNNIQALLAFDLISYSEGLKYAVFVSIAFITATLLFKIACAPFHFWSPDVYDGAPLGSTIIFSIVPKISIFFFFMKWFNCIKLISNSLPTIIISFGILSVFVGTFFALNQKKLKRLIIYSSIAQTGFLVIGIGILSLKSFSYTLFFLGLYIITSILIWGHFVLFYNFSNKTNTFYKKTLYPLYISTLNNLFEYNRAWALSITIILFSVAGIPPFTGFLSKMLIIYGLTTYNYIEFAILLVLLSAISVYYYIRILKVAYFEPGNKRINEDFKTIFSNKNFEILTLIIPTLLILLIIIIYNPTFFLLISEYLAFGSYSF